MMKEGKKYKWDRVIKELGKVGSIRKYTDAHHFEVFQKDMNRIHRFGDVDNAIFIYEGSYSFPKNVSGGCHEKMRGECNGCV